MNIRNVFFEAKLPFAKCKYLHLLIPLFFCYFGGSCCSTSNETLVEYYVTPIDPFLRFYDNGVFEYSLQQLSINKVLSPSDQLGLGKDSSCVLFYFSEILDSKTTAKYLPLPDTNLKFGSPVKALVIFHHDKVIDTFKVDPGKCMQKSGETFRAGRLLSEHIASILPVEYLEGWMYGPFGKSVNYVLYPRNGSN